MRPIPQTTSSGYPFLFLFPGLVTVSIMSFHGLAILQHNKRWSLGVHQESDSRGNEFRYPTSMSFNPGYKCLETWNISQDDQFGHQISLDSSPPRALGPADSIICVHTICCEFVFAMYGTRAEVLSQTLLVRQSLIFITLFFLDPATRSPYLYVRHCMHILHWFIAGATLLFMMIVLIHSTRP